MTTQAQDARLFVEGVTQYLRRGAAANAMLPRVTAALHTITAAAREGSTAMVQSAAPLTAKEKGNIARFLSRLLTHAVRVQCRTNKALIGGLRIVVGDWVIDTSIASQIRAMQEALIQ